MSARSPPTASTFAAAAAAQHRPRKDLEVDEEGEGEGEEESKQKQREEDELKLVDALEEDDDVQTVWGNYEVPDDVMAKLG